MRRQPAPDERKRDADRTRERILEAAIAEFGAHGFAGARVSAIAQRAGVNQQLISYYFDGKAGLYQALTDRWREVSAGLNTADRPLAEVVVSFLAQDAQTRNWARLLTWNGLTGADSDDSFFGAMVDDIKRRQAAGEISSEVDPGMVLLILFSATLAPVSLPQVVKGMTGLAADSPEFLRRYGETLKKIVEML